MRKTDTLASAERKAILDALKRYEWNVRRAAIALLCSRKGLYLKMKKHGIKRP